MEKQIKIKLRNLKEKVDELTSENSSLERKNSKLLDEIKTLEKKLLGVPVQLNHLILEAREKGFKQGEISKSDSYPLLKLEAKVAEWRLIIGEMAHSINSDVYISYSKLDRLSKTINDPNLKTAMNHVNKIRDLTSLIMLELKRDETKISGDMRDLSLNIILKNEFYAIKNSLPTLRLSEEEHKVNLEKMPLQFSTSEECIISINDEFSEVPTMIIRDLLRNALKNTKMEKPEVEISLLNIDDHFQLEIKNNSCIHESFANWFNNENPDDDSPEMSTSTKVGLRVIKKWAQLLKVKAELVRDEINNCTIAVIKFPKEVKYVKPD